LSNGNGKVKAFDKYFVEMIFERAQYEAGVIPKPDSPKSRAVGTLRLGIPGPALRAVPE
jgi:hypothetical protein